MKNYDRFTYECIQYHMLMLKFSCTTVPRALQRFPTIAPHSYFKYIPFPYLGLFNFLVRMFS